MTNDDDGDDSLQFWNDLLFLLCYYLHRNFVARVVSLIHFCIQSQSDDDFLALNVLSNHLCSSFVRLSCFYRWVRLIYLVCRYFCYLNLSKWLLQN